MSNPTNNLALVVLIHNQASNIARLAKAYKGLVEKPALFVFVLDRCNDDSANLLKEHTRGLAVKIVEINEGLDFQAGRNRDIGLIAAEETIPECDVVFLDGDCVPSDQLIAEHIKNLNMNAGFPTFTVARRVNESKEGRDVEDNRLNVSSSIRRVFGTGIDRIVFSKEPAMSRLLTWSCNLGLNRSAIKLCRYVNKQLNRCDKRVFNPSFDGNWGGEDDFVGMTAHYFGAAVVAINPVHHVRHIWHVSRESQRYETTMHVKYGELKDLAMQLEAPGVAKIKTANVIDDIDRCASAVDSFEIDNSIMSRVFMLLGIYKQFDKIGLASTMMHPMWLFAKDAKLKVRTQETLDAWKNLRTKLDDSRRLDMPSTDLINLKWSNPTGALRQTCNVCGSKSGFFANSRCVDCNSYPWHRAFKRMFNPAGLKAVFNPDTQAEQIIFAEWDKFSFEGLRGETKADLENLPIADNTYDIIYLAHTMEHVRNEAKALRELHRVIKHGGTVIVSVPLSDNRATDEDLDSRLKPEDRIRRFWWHDHWRLYGRDAAQRFGQYGFEVELRQAWQVYGVEAVNPNETFFLLKKVSVETKKADKPSSLYLDVYESCNYACKHCNIHMIKDEHVVDLDLYKSAIEEFAAMGGHDVQFSSGETLLRFEVITELLKHASSNGLVCNIVTNGSTVQSKERAEALKAAGLSNATISIDSHIADIHDDIRGVSGAFEKALKAQQLLKEAGVKTNASCVLTSKNLNDFETYEQAMKAAGFDSVSCTLLEPTFAQSRFKRDTYFEENRIKDATALVQVLKKIGTWSSKSIESAVNYVASNTISAGSCGSSDRNIMMRRNGNVSLCYGKPSIGVYVEGNLAEIWSGQAAETRRHLDKSCISACGISDCHRRKLVNS